MEEIKSPLNVIVPLSKGYGDALP